MKILAVLTLVGTYIMSAYDGDLTAAVVLTLLFLPILFERGEKKCTSRNAHTVGRR